MSSPTPDTIAQAKQAARRDGWDPEEVIPYGSPTRMSGDELTDGPEAAAWMFYEPASQRRHGLAPLGPNPAKLAKRAA